LQVLQGLRAAYVLHKAGEFAHQALKGAVARMAQDGTIVNLASGGTIRLTPYLVEVRPPNTAPIPIDMQQLSGVTRYGQQVTIQRWSNGPLHLDMASLDDAGRLELHVRSSVQSVQAYAPTQFAQQAPSTKGGMSKLAIVGIILGICVVLGVIGSMMDSSDNPSSASFSSARPTATRVQSQSSGTSFRDGTHRVGADIQAGTYRNSNSSNFCYWERLSGFGGTIGDVIANNVSYDIQTVSIKRSDAGFKSIDCGTWTRIGT
jgi:hypothetical protein